MSIRSQYLKEVLKDLESVRQRNQAVSAQRFAEIRQKLPQVFTLRESMAQKTAELIQKAMQQQNLADLQAELSDHQRETTLKISQYLEAAGYPATYLEPMFNCPACRDSGFLENQTPCHCLQAAFIEKAYHKSNLATTFAEQNFSKFSLQVYSEQPDTHYGVSPRDNMRRIYQQCDSFAENFEKKYQNLFLSGPSGLGKTFLCSCIAKKVLDRGFLVLYLSAARFFRYFEQNRFHQEQSGIDEEFLNGIRNCDLLILDDLGTEVITAVSQSDFFHTLNYRITEKKPTVISTNFSVGQLSKVYSERIVSRILGEYTPLVFFGRDIRKERFQH